MATRMQQRRGTAAQWISTNSGNGPILSPGEIGFESDTNKFKIGDGVNHWIDLTYFVDLESVLGGISGVDLPAALDTLNELAAALGDDPNYASTITTALGNKQDKVSGVSDTEIGYLDGVTSSIQTQLNSKLASTDLSEAAQDAVNTAIIAGTGLDKTYDDNGNTITLDIDSTVATKTFAAELLTNATKTNITIAGDKDGLTITAENGVADSTTDNLTEGSTNKYFTDERAQDAIGNSLGSGLSYNDSTGAISVNTSDIQARVSGVSDTEIGYLDGVTSAIQTQIDSKLSKSGGTMTGDLTLAGAPTSDLHAATKLYVDNVTAGINFHESVHAASTINLATNYNNGTDGVGATLTADTNRAFAILDGESVTLGQRVLIKNQTDQKQNGIYTLTTVGSGSTPWVLTRATDADNNPSGEMKNGDFCLVINGTVNASYGFINNSATNPIVIGTDNITYTQFNAGKTVVAGNGLQEATPGTISIDTTVTQTRVSGVSDTEIGYLDGVTSGIQGQLDAKAPLASPTFTGTVTIPNNAALGTPASVTLTNATGLPITTGVSGLGTDIATFLATPSSANLISAVTDETGTGSLVFANTPTLVTPNIGAATGTSLTATGGGVLARAASTQDGVEIRGRAGGTGNWEVILTPTTLTADRTLTLPNETGTLLTTAQFTAKGALLVGTGTGTYAVQSVGTNGQVLAANSAQADGVEWVTPAGGAAFNEFMLIGA